MDLHIDVLAFSFEGSLSLFKRCSVLKKLIVCNIQNLFFENWI